MSYFNSAKPQPVSDPVKLTKYGLLRRSEAIERLCIAFPMDREVIIGLAELNPDRWPKLEMVKPSSKAGEVWETIPPDDRAALVAALSITGRPTYMLVWVD